MESFVTVVDRSPGLEGVGPGPADLLFPEARRRRRRRRRIVAGIVALGLLLVAIELTAGVVAGGLRGSRPHAPGSSEPLVNGSPGMVSGVLKLEAGLSPAGFHGLPGEVSLISSRGMAHSMNVGSDGKFLMSVPAGNYTAIGRSPNYLLDDDTRWPCRSRSPVVVQTGVTSTITVVCEGM